MTPMALGGPYLLFGFIVLLALMYFMSIRPQRKQMEQRRQMQNSMQPGTRVMLNSGIFGTITASGEKQVVLELAPGVDVTVSKQAIVSIVKPEDEEFEFDDAQSDADKTVADENTTDTENVAAVEEIKAEISSDATPGTAEQSADKPASNQAAGETGTEQK